MPKASSYLMYGQDIYDTAHIKLIVLTLKKLKTKNLPIMKNTSKTLLQNERKGIWSSDRHNIHNPH